jgi:hypothetical protein
MVKHLTVVKRQLKGNEHFISVPISKTEAKKLGSTTERSSGSLLIKTCIVYA